MAALLRWEVPGLSIRFNNPKQIYAYSELPVRKVI
jgi:hypothetical protein